MRHILSVADNGEFYSLRNTVLRSAGFRVTAAVGVGEARTHIANTLFDGVLLGHMLTEHETNELAAAAKRKSDLTKVCALHQSFGYESPFIDNHINVHDGPEALIRCLGDSLRDPNARQLLPHNFISTHPVGWRCSECKQIFRVRLPASPGSNPEPDINIQREFDRHNCGEYVAQTEQKRKRIANSSGR